MEIYETLKTKERFRVLNSILTWWCTDGQYIQASFEIRPDEGWNTNWANSDLILTELRELYGRDHETQDI